MKRALSTRNLRARAALTLLVGLASAGCKDRGQPNAEPSPAESALAAEQLTTRVEQVALLDLLPQCDVFHHGLLIDVGAPTEAFQRGFGLGPFPDSAAAKRGTSTYGRMSAKRVDYHFWLTEPLAEAVVALRAQAEQATGASVYLDDKRLGSLKFPSEEMGVVTSGRQREPLGPGRHTLKLRFFGRGDPKAPGYAALDWIRIGSDSIPMKRYAAPTRNDIVEDVALNNVPARALVLRAPSQVRCLIRTAAGARFRTKVGMWGSGSGTAEVRALVDGEAPIVLGSKRVTEGDSKWQELDLPLDRFESALIGIELAVTEIDGAGRIAFGEPAVARESPPVPPMPQASDVVVVVFSGLERGTLPPWGDAARYPMLADVARSSAALGGYRVASTGVGSVMASLLTGLSVRGHAVTEPDSVLPRMLPTVAERVRQDGGAAAMFTSVPYTFPAFGFDRGWDQFAFFTPVGDISAIEPFRRALTFLSDGGLLERSHKLVVVHARGGHPPWDLSKQEVRTLPPEEYTGVLDPRRGGIALAQLRSQPQSAARKLRDTDWERLRAMQGLTLSHQEQAFGRIVRWLRGAGKWDDTLVVVMGDVAMGPEPFPPFAATPDLDETRLMVPLLVKFPAGAHAGVRSLVRVSTQDVVQTVLLALNATDSADPPRSNLSHLIVAGEPLDGEPSIATQGDRYSARWGNWLLRGVIPTQPSLCRLDVDPACAHDAFDRFPLVAAGMWRRAFALLRASEEQSTPQPVTATIDDSTAAALMVWGD